MQEVKNLYVDFDGVIVNTIKAIVTLYNEDFQYYRKFKPVDWQEINTWDFEECICADKKILDSYFNMPRFFNLLGFMDSAYEAINKMKLHFHLIIVSMGYRPNLVGKSVWIKDNLPFSDFIGVDMKEYVDKKHIDMSDGIFIDDSMNNLVTSNAKHKILFGSSYPWNENWRGKRCQNWMELEEYLLRGDYVKT